MQSCSEPKQWFILPDLKHTTGRLDLVTGAPSGDESAREHRVDEIDGDGVVKHPRIPDGVMAQPSPPQF
jgi:hypothetical protein